MTEPDNEHQNPGCPIASAGKDSRPLSPKPKRRWYQFSLRTLLLLVVLVSIGMSWFAVKMNQARRQRAAVEALVKVGGRVCYDFEVAADGSFIPDAEPPGPAWLRNLLGVDFFSDVVRLDLSFEPACDADLEHLAELTKLERLDLDGTQITDAGLEHLAALTKLKFLHLGDTQVTGVGLEHLAGLTKLEWLILDGARVTDEAVEKLQQALPNCEIEH